MFRDSSLLAVMGEMVLLSLSLGSVEVLGSGVDLSVLTCSDIVVTTFSVGTRLPDSVRTISMTASSASFSALQIPARRQP